MKNKHSIFLITLLLTSLIQLNAQYSKGFININGGLSALSGNITKSDNYLDLKQGFAKSSGLEIAIDAGWFFNKNIGVGIIVSSSNYGIKNQGILSAGYVEAFAVAEVTMTVNSYRILNILPAFYCSLPMDKLNIDFRLMVGYSNLTTPKVKVQLEDNVDTPLIQNESTGGGLGLGIGAGLRYQITSHFGAALKVDYINSKPNVDITYTNLNNPTDKFRLLKNYNESIGSINSSFGIVYNF